jgi:hypothetical protein
MTTLAGSQNAPSLLQRVLLAGLAGGAVDFVYASALAILRGRGFERPWQTVASGWMGKAAAEGGWGSVALGIVTHFGIATVMALAYVLAASRLHILKRRPLLCGVLYGLVLYGVMYGIVLPTRFGRAYQWNGMISVMDILAHIGVGLAIALVTARWSGARREG